MTNKKIACVSDLIGMNVRDAKGQSLGRVHEVRTKDSEVKVLICGASGLLQRMAGFRTGARIKWEQVREITEETILCDRGKGER
jgi:sporulation protein YlmC with PRC-barrel domain